MKFTMYVVMNDAGEYLYEGYDYGDRYFEFDNRLHIAIFFTLKDTADIYAKDFGGIVKEIEITVKD